MSTSKKMFLLFSHTLTKTQIEDARSSLEISEFVEMPEELAKLWAAVPPEAKSLNDVLKPIQNWLSEESSVDDVVLITGDFGCSHNMAVFCEKNRLRAVYATTERKSVEVSKPDGTIETKRVFEHVQFRKYFQPYCKTCGFVGDVCFVHMTFNGITEEEFIEKKVSEGWTRFDYYSDYYGSHSEYGEGDIEETYLFSPEINIPTFGDFAHGHRNNNESNDLFDSFVESLDESQYLII